MILNFSQTRGAIPVTPEAVFVALEACVTQNRATAMIGAAWVMVEAFTGRNYWPVTAAELTADASESLEIFWPRFPAPAAVTVERLQGRNWVADDGPWWDRGRLFFCAPGARYRVTQTGTLTPPEPGANVVEAVRGLALYSLIHSPARREFREVQSGDSTLTREALGGLFQASGAGLMLATEVRW